MKLFSGVIAVAAAVACSIAWLGLASQAEAHTVYVPTWPASPDTHGSLVPIEDGEAQDPVEGPWTNVEAAAITPDGEKLYVVDRDSGTIYAVATRSHEILAQIPGPAGAYDIAISPRGDLAYVTSMIEGVRAIDTSEDKPLGPVEAGYQPLGVAFAPDGERAYVTNYQDISVIDAETHEEVERITDDGMSDLLGMAITPDGKTLYVANADKDNVLAIDTDTGDVIATIAVGPSPRSIAITPDGKRAYVANWLSDMVSVIDTKTNAVEATITAGTYPSGISTTPDGKRVYVTNWKRGTVTVIDTTTNAVEKTISLGTDVLEVSVWAVAAVPNQPPTAELRAGALEVFAGTPVTFDASGSSDDEGIASYTFDFGDGARATTAQPTRKHVYTEPGTYSATVTVDDGVGCEPIPDFFELGLASPFTGHTAHCNGPSRATSEPVEIQVIEASALRLRVGVKRTQRSLRRVRVAATCEGADCRVRAWGALHVKRPGRKAQRFALAPDARELKAGAKSRLEPRIPAQARRAARKALKEGGKVRAKLRVRATGPTGQERVRMRVVRIVRR
ncbi:MAG TPA: PKD domain-containing protein [Solirubrobacterales bacterium]|jgi:YVTN family beta-propeller protein